MRNMYMYTNHVAKNGTVQDKRLVKLDIMAGHGYIGILSRNLIINEKKNKKHSESYFLVVS